MPRQKFIRSDNLSKDYRKETYITPDGVWFLIASTSSSKGKLKMWYIKHHQKTYPVHYADHPMYIDDAIVWASNLLWPSRLSIISTNLK